MRQLCFSIYDKKSAVFLKPLFESSTASAERGFHFMVNDPHPANLIRSFPDDYAFYYLGYVDDDTGLLVALDRPVLLLDASSVLKVAA